MTTSERTKTVILVVGMAGSGKTSLVRRLISHIQSYDNGSVYTVNLDPAVLSTPFPVNIDIRDTISYKNVMTEYGLGPNGAIVTSLNLFSTKLDTFISLIENSTADYVIIDTPGQIEVFTWSASGNLITSTLSSRFRTVLVYVLDTPRSSNVCTFMSNMMYACSILYRCRLPLVCALNKSDLGESERVRGWMEDFDSFQLAVEQETSYMGSLVLSMGLALEEFYNILEVAECSAVTGYGMDDLLVAIDEAEDIDKVEVDDATHSAQSDSNSADDTKATALSDTNDSESLEKTRKANDLSRFMRDLALDKEAEAQISK